MVFSQDGIFSRAEQAVDKHGEAKARETLELALGEAQMQKYEEGLTDEQLTNKINEIGEEIEERETPDISQAIVDGYIFSIDRTVPKILNYIGPADGVIITAKVSGNGGWFKQGDTINVTVTGRIKTYSGGNITTVSATKGGTAITGFSIDNDGKYTIDNITSDTTIVINAKDSNNKENTKTIPITIRIDNIPPILDKVNARVEGMKIIINAQGHDNETGLKQFNYKISSTEDTDLSGIPADKRTGSFLSGEMAEILATESAKYTVTITAIDNAENESETALSDTISIFKIILEVGSTVDIAKLTNITGNLAYESSNNNIVKVSNDGKITGVSVGQGIIKAQNTLDTIDSDSFLFEIVDSIDFNNLNWRVKSSSSNATHTINPFTLSVRSGWDEIILDTTDIVCLTSGKVKFETIGTPWAIQAFGRPVICDEGFLESTGGVATTEEGIRLYWRIQRRKRRRKLQSRSSVRKLCQ